MCCANTLTFIMAYSTQPPFTETNSVSDRYKSFQLLMGNVNRDNVKNAVKLAV